MNYWEENLSFFKKNVPGIYRRMLIPENERENNVEVTWDAKKMLCQVTQKGKKIWLGSTINPQRETEKLLHDCDRDDGLVLLLGIANIKLMKEIKSYFRSLRRLIIVEPSITIFNLIMANMSVRKLFEDFPDTEITMIIGEGIDEVSLLYKSFNSQHPGETTSPITPVGYSQLFPFYKTKIDEFAEVARKQEYLSVATNNFFRYMWTVNQWRNLSIPDVQFQFIKELNDKVPVLIVSAGPSLNKNMHLLKKIGNRALLIAVGSAIHVLHSNGIVPHLRMSIEGNSLQERLFEGIDPADCPLLYCDSIYYKIAERFKDNSIQFYLYKNNRIKGYFMAKFGVALPEMSSGHSVANMAAFMAAFFGFKKAIVVGQDLSYKDNENYAKGSWTTEKENQKNFDYTDKLFMKNIYGEDVVTVASFLSVRDTFAMAARWYSEVHFINATEGGLNIEGFENKSLAMVLQEDLPEESIDIRAFLQEGIAKGKETPLMSKEFIEHSIKSTRADVLNLQKRIKILRRLVQVGVRDNKLEKIKKEYQRIRDDLVYRHLFYSFFTKEERAIKAFMYGDDVEKREKVFVDFCDALDKFILFTFDLMDEYLSGERKYNIIYQA